MFEKNPPHFPPLCQKREKNREFVFTRASWVLSQMVLMTCAPAEAAPLFALDWWHMLSRRAISRAGTPQCPGETPCNPSTTVSQWQRQTLNKQRVWLCLSLSLFIVFQSVSFSVPPLPLFLSLPVTSSSPVLFIPPLPFPLMSPLRLTWWMTLYFGD